MRLKKLLLALLILYAIVAITNAQSTQTGSLIGVVLGNGTESLPGVKVTITSPAMILPSLTAITNENGVYRFSNLTPGLYAVTFELDGFSTVIRKDVRISSIQTVSLRTSLEQQAIKEVITVVGKSPTVDTQRQTRATNLDAEFLKSIPAARNLSSFVNMAPGMISNGELTSAHGSGTMENSYALDGVNIADPQLNMPYVGFSMDMMDEVSVQAGGLSAEFGSTKGAMVNVVTKSGGNKLSGAASFFYNHESLRSDNTKGTPLAGQQSGNKYEIEPDLNIGGPVIKDKMWFFANLGLYKSASYSARYPYVYPYVEGTKQDPILMNRLYPYLKLTLQPDEKNRFVLSYTHSSRSLDDRLPWWGATYWTKQSTIFQREPTLMLNLSWNHSFGSNLYVNFKVAAVDYRLSIDGKGSTPYVINWGYNYNSGNWFRKTDLNERNRYNVNVDATTFVDNLLGSHELKIGGEAQLARIHWKIETVDTDPVTGGQLTYMYGADYGYAGYVVPFNRREAANNFFGFIQDTWRVGRKLTINLGLRAEYNSIVWPRQNVDEAPFEVGGVTFDRRMPDSITASKWTTLAPRVGMIFDLFGNNTTLIKASYSRYTAPNYTEMINLAHPNGWVWYNYGLDANGHKAYWDWLGGPGTVKVGYKNYKLKAPYADEFTVGFERELFSDWSFGARFIRKWDKNLIQQVDASQLDMDKLMATGVLDWSKNWEQVTVTDPFSHQQVTFWNKLSFPLSKNYIVNPPGAERNYSGLEVTLAKRFSKKWSLNASYVFGKATGTVNNDAGGEARGTSGLYANPNNWVNNNGDLLNESRHQFKLQAMVKGPLGFNLSGYFCYLSGLRWTRMVNSRYLIPGVLNQAQSIMAETRGSEEFPDTKQLDLRLEKAFKFGNFTFSAFADCFNVFNQARATSVVADSSNPYQVYGTMLSINAPRIFQLGARIEFN